MTPAPAGPDIPAARAGRRALWFVLLLSAAFVVQGLVFIPYVGIQNDEALFAAGLYQPYEVEYSVRVLGRSVPVMVMNYVGALKLRLYAVIFKFWPPSPFSVRVPVLVIGAATIWLFYLLMRKTVGLRAALAGCALLAVDTSFLLTTCFDWGPVALQHLLLVGGVVLLWSFHDRGRLVHLGAGCFLFGLGVWDKALFIWMLGGLAAATLAVFPGELRSKLRPRNIAVAAFCFCLGALPFLVYNQARRLGTFRGTARFSAAEVNQKAVQVRLALDGSSLFGYLVRDDPEAKPDQPRTSLERWSIALSDVAGQPESGLLGVALVLAVILLPWLWETPALKPMMFALVFMAVTWVQMAFTLGAGGGAHHAVLLWPFPHFFIAAAFAEASRYLRRVGLALLVLVLSTVCASNLLVTNQHLAQLVGQGTAVVWTDAISPLSDYLERARPQQVYVTDWGILDALRLLNRGGLPLLIGSDPMAAEAVGKSQKRDVHEIISAPDAVFVGHTQGNEVAPGINARLESLAQADGYRKEVLQVIADRNGRPIFEVYRFRPISAEGRRS